MAVTRRCTLSCSVFQDPEHYADDNHKPEMTIALTPFEGMCGFRPISEIAAFCSTYPEFAAAVGEAECARLVGASGGADGDTKGCLKACFTALMMQEAKVVQAQLAGLIARVEQVRPAPLTAAASRGFAPRPHYPVAPPRSCVASTWLRWDHCSVHAWDWS